jgi:hypothetical protein
MIIIQEFSGETLFKLSQEVLQLETATLWIDVDVLVLQDFIRFNADQEIVYSGQEVLKSLETFLALLKSIQISNPIEVVLEVQLSMFDRCGNFPEVLGRVYNFVKKHKFFGIKLCIGQNDALNFGVVRHILNVLNNEEIVDKDWLLLLEVHESKLTPPGLIHMLISVADYVLFPLQGYFQYQFTHSVYNNRIEKLVCDTDRSFSKVLAHLNNWVIQGIPCSKLVAYIATTGVVMEFNPVEEYVYKVFEVARADIYRRMTSGVEIRNEYCDVFYDNVEDIYTKVTTLMTQHNFGGVCMQDMGHDLLWLDSRSVYSVVQTMRRAIMFGRIFDSPVPLLNRTNGTLQAANNVPVFPSRASTTETKLI